ncbi:MAG: DUF885 family protein, partial [Proteobacteria bacterium]|nr:DUF885 family protein [Pseudomonadota bacterium]
MMDRRQLLKSSAALGALACAPALFAAPAGAASGSAEDARLNALFDRIMTEAQDRSPEFVTSLGYDKGERAAAKGKLDDRSLGAWEEDKARTRRQLAELKAIDRSKLTGLGPSNYDAVLFGTELQDQFNQLPMVGGPYAVSQLGGAYQGVPDFLDSQHSIETSADAEAYLSRLGALATAIAQENEQVRHDAGVGVIPPDFIIKRTLAQLKTLAAAPPASANLVQSLARRTAEKHLAGDWEGRAGKIYTTQIQPALASQIALFESLAPKAVHEAGVRRLPRGEELYALGLKAFTTSTMPPAEIHKTGLALLAEQNAELDTLFRGLGMTQGTPGARLKALYADTRYHYPNTDPGKEQLIADLNKLVEKISARLPEWFGTLPKARLDIRRVPKATEEGAPGGYYQPGALDGTRPGAY